MKEHEVRERAIATRLTNPVDPPGPYRFVDREFSVMTYWTADSGAALLNIAHQGVTESPDFYWCRELPLSCEADSSMRIVN